MPRDVSGTYTAPANSWNPAVANSIIDPVDWNATQLDYVDALTDSLSRTGDGHMEVALNLGGFPPTNTGLTAHGVMLAQNTTAITATAVGATKSVLQGATGADPAFTTTPTVAGLVVSNNAAALPTLGGSIINAGAADGTSTQIEISSFGSAQSILGLTHASNTAASPSATTSGTALGAVAGYGYGSTGYSSAARAGINLVAAETWTDTHQGTYISFFTTVLAGGAGGTQIVAKFEDTGALSLGVAGTLVGAINFFNATSGSIALKPVTGALGSAILSLPDATDTLIGKATTDSLTNKTFNSAGTGNVMQISGVTVSRGQLPGTATNDAATAGNNGELVTNSATGVSLSNNTITDVVTISLGAGDWDVYGFGSFNIGATTSFTQVIVSLSDTSVTLGTALGQGATVLNCSAVVPGVTIEQHTAGPIRVSLTGATTYYLVCRIIYTSTAVTAGGYIRARRVR